MLSCQLTGGVRRGQITGKADERAFRCGGESANGRVDRLLGAAVDDYRGTFAAEYIGNGETDTGCAAGDQGAFVGKLKIY